MEFDKNKILTCVTADQAKVGMKGWIGSSVESLKSLVMGEAPLMELIEIDAREFAHVPFHASKYGWGILFYPAPEPTPTFNSLKDYVLAELDWVEKNRVWAGAKVRIVKPFSEGENHCGCFGSDIYSIPTSIIGEKFTVKNVVPKGINLLYSYLKRKDGSVSSWFTVPFYALEVVDTIKDDKLFESAEYLYTMNAFRKYADGLEPSMPSYPTFKVGDMVEVDTYDFRVATVIDPCDKEDFMYVDMEHIRTGVKKHSCKLVTYRPFANAEEFRPYRDEWFNQKDVTKAFTPVRAVNYCNAGVVMCKSVSMGKGATFELCSYADLLKYFVRENGEPCGVREEA